MSCTPSPWGLTTTRWTRPLARSASWCWLCSIPRKPGQERLAAPEGDVSDTGQREWVLMFPEGHEPTDVEKGVAQDLIDFTRAAMQAAKPYLPPGTIIRLLAEPFPEAITTP